MNNKLNIFSVYSGIAYQVNESEWPLLDDGQIPLTKSVPSCKKCFSRGYTGFSSQKFVYIPCACVNKIADNARIKSKFNITSKSDRL